MIDTVGFSDKMKASVGKGLTDSFKLDVNVDLVLRDSKGRVKQHEKVHNTVTSGGLEAVMDQLLASPTVGKPGWMDGNIKIKEASNGFYSLQKRKWYGS